MYICIAGKNECAVNALKHLLLHKFKKRNILVLPNNNDKGIDSWKTSLKKFAKKIPYLKDEKAPLKIPYTFDYNKLVD